MKILLVLAMLLLCPAPSLLVPSADYWEHWGPWGECSRSCGTGVTVRERKCVTHRTDRGMSCVGPSKSYQSCNIQDCPEGSRDFREEQCAQFDGVEIHGKRFKWLPYYGGENPCELNCIPKGENFFYRHLPAVADGTPCYPGQRDICVEGVCKRLGCDSMLESPQQEDPCLQCGGSGHTCQLIQGVFSMRSLPAGYNQMIIIPVGATTIRIRETVATRNYLAVKNLRGEYYLNGDWVIDYSRATPIAGTVLYYQRGAEGDMAPEIITGRGPTTEPLIIELISQEENQGVDYEYYVSQSHSKEGYFWSYGSWSECTKDCGSGYQSRLVFCTIDNEAYPDYLCSALPRPLGNRTCNVQPCPQTRSWKMGGWSSCSASCRGGSQTRSVQCLSHDTEGTRVVEDSVCAAYSPRPLAQQSCNQQQCAEFSMSQWSLCSVTCGTGEQTRDVVCAGAAGVRLQDYACGGMSRPLRVQPCHMPPCYNRIAWHIGDWGLCSKSCDSGMRERQVICSDKERNLYGPERCEPHPKPSTLELCNTQPCYTTQVVPSMQDPRGYDNTQHGFLPFTPDNPTPVYRQERVDTLHTNTVGESSPCSQSYYGCCPDGHTHARGYAGVGCPSWDCTQSRYGCCQDGVTEAWGPNKEGCVDYSVNPSTDFVPPLGEPSEQCRSASFGCCHDRVTLASGPNGEGCPNPPVSALPPGCLLPHTAGPCSDWTARYYYDLGTSTCNHFWYGGCKGNRNTFMSKEECERDCRGATEVQPYAVHRRESRILTPQRVRDMRRVFTVRQGSSSDSTHDTVAATQAQSAGVYQHRRHPAPSQVQHTFPTASLGVSIDKSDPSSVEGRVGQTVVLPCRVTPAPSSAVIVEWRRDGVAIPATRHKQQPNGSLLVGPLTLQDSGWLLCVATRGRERDHRYIYLSVSDSSLTEQTSKRQNGFENHGSGVVQPSVNNRPQKNSQRFSIDQSDSTLVEGRLGQKARLPCSVSPTSTMRSVTIEWTKDGRSLNSGRHVQQPDGSLTISQLTSEDSGVYTCTVSNHQHKDQRQLQLRVLMDFRITTAPSNVQVSRGGTAQLLCVVSGENVGIGWSRNGVPVRSDGRRVQLSQDGSLILNNVQPEDEGSYTCNAYTGTHSISATAEVRLTKDLEPGLAVGGDISSDCVDQPDLANCKLIVYSRLCSNQYYSSFCCASCARYALDGEGQGQLVKA